MANECTAFFTVCCGKNAGRCHRRCISYGGKHYHEENYQVREKRDVCGGKQFFKT